MDAPTPMHIWAKLIKPNELYLKVFIFLKIRHEIGKNWCLGAEKEQEAFGRRCDLDELYKCMKFPKEKIFKYYLL